MRGLILDMYVFMGDFWIFHNLFGGKCYKFIEDYVHAIKGLTKVFINAGISKCWLLVSKIPKNGEYLPTVTEMITKNQCLVVLTSMPLKEATESIAYQWRYITENEHK